MCGWLACLVAGFRPPVITEEPSNLHVFVGSSFFLPCETNNVLADTYQWLKDGAVLSANSNLIVRQGVGLQILHARKAHSGVYQCVVTNSAGTVNASAEVQVTDTVITCDGEQSITIIYVLDDHS